LDKSQNLKLNTDIIITMLNTTQHTLCYN